MGQEKAEWALCASSLADPLDLVWTKQQAEQGGWETFGGNFVTHILCKSLLVCSVIGLGGTDHVTESSKVLFTGWVVWLLGFSPWPASPPAVCASFCCKWWRLCLPGFHLFVLNSEIHKITPLCGHLSVYYNEDNWLSNCLLNGLLNSVIARGTSAQIIQLFNASQIPSSHTVCSTFWEDSWKHSFFFLKILLPWSYSGDFFPWDPDLRFLMSPLPFHGQCPQSHIPLPSVCWHHVFSSWLMSCLHNQDRSSFSWVPLNPGLPSWPHHLAQLHLFCLSLSPWTPCSMLSWTFSKCLFHRLDFCSATLMAVLCSQLQTESLHRGLFYVYRVPEYQHLEEILEGCSSPKGGCALLVHTVYF